MKTQELMKIIKDAVGSLHEKKITAISVDAFIKYLDELERYVATIKDEDEKNHEIALATFRVEHERNLAYYEAQQQNSMEMLRSVIAYGQAALKSAILINGGAAAGLLAFIGNIWTKDIAPPAVHSLTIAVILFSAGVLCAALGTGCTYVTQYFYSEMRQRIAKFFHVVTIVFVIGSYILFGFGSWSAYQAFLKHLSRKDSAMAGGIAHYTTNTSALWDEVLSRTT